MPAKKLEALAKQKKLSRRERTSLKEMVSMSRQGEYGTLSEAMESHVANIYPEEVDAILKSLLDNQLVCGVYDPKIGGTVIKSTILGDKLFKALEYYIDTKRVNKDIEAEKKEIKKAENKVRNQKIMAGLQKGFEKSMFMATDAMVKIAKAQTGQEQKKGKARKKSKPKKQENPFGNMEKMWKL